MLPGPRQAPAEAEVAGLKPDQADDGEHAALFVAIQRGNPNWQENSSPPRDLGGFRRPYIPASPAAWEGADRRIPAQGLCQEMECPEER
jgi:hypothetical protein